MVILLSKNYLRRLIIKKEKKINGRLTDVRRGAGCITLFEDFPVGESLLVLLKTDFRELDFKVEIVNPDKSFFSKDDVSEVVIPAYEGEMGILKDHISIISFLKPGIIKIDSKSRKDEFYVEDGIIEFKDNCLSILGFGRVRNANSDWNFNKKRLTL